MPAAEREELEQLPSQTMSSTVFAFLGCFLQTLANVYLALENDLEIIPVLNKIDLPGGWGWLACPPACLPARPPARPPARLPACLLAAWQQTWLQQPMWLACVPDFVELRKCSGRCVGEEGSGAAGAGAMRFNTGMGLNCPPPGPPSAGAELSACHRCCAGRRRGRRAGEA